MDSKIKIRWYGRDHLDSSPGTGRAFSNSQRGQGQCFIYSVIEYCTINPINGGPETNDIVLKFYAVYIAWIYYYKLIEGSSAEWIENQSPENYTGILKMSYTR